MCKHTIRVFFVSLLLACFSWSSGAQEIEGGKVEYDQINYHKFELREGQGSERYNNFVSNLPSETKDLKVLIIKGKKSVYKQSLKPDDPGLARMKMGIQRVNTLKPPKVELKEVYCDLAKDDLIKQVEFMSRFFLLEEKTKQSLWKIGNKQVKIQGYTCQNASMQKGEQTITAWFSPEIPISTGPAGFEGLPGLILSIEVDGRNTILATDVDLTKPDDKLKKPKEGTKVDQDELDEIVAEKIEEWKRTSQGRRGAKAGGR